MNDYKDNARTDKRQHIWPLLVPFRWSCPWREKERDRIYEKEKDQKYEYEKVWYKKKSICVVSTYFRMLCGPLVGRKEEGIMNNQRIKGKRRMKRR